MTGGGTARIHQPSAPPGLLPETAAPSSRMIDELRPLVDALQPGDRLTARPSCVLLERPEAMEPLQLPWPIELHRSVLEAIGTPVEVCPGVVASTVRGTLTLVRAWTSECDALARYTRQLESDPLFNTLNSIASLGRNVLFAGKWVHAYRLFHVLLDVAHRPGCFDDASIPAPAEWVRFGDPEELAIVGPDRSTLWRCGPAEVARYARMGSALFAWIGASRLDAALIAYEAGFDRVTPRMNSQLQMLASIDFVVTLDRSSGELQDMAELVVEEGGYRPRLVSRSAPVVNPTSADGVDFTEPVNPPETALVQAPNESALRVHQPGWELDQIESTEFDPTDHAPPNVDESSFAASFGLAPPPRPPGVRGETFNDILKRMREKERGNSDL